MTRRPDDSEHRGDPGPLFAPPRARNTDPHTSHRAAASVDEKASDTIRRRVLALLQTDGMLTDEEIAVRFALHHWPGSPSGIRTRRKELVQAGLVFDTGNLREMASGRVGIVWGAK